MGGRNGQLGIAESWELYGVYLTPLWVVNNCHTLFTAVSLPCTKGDHFKSYITGRVTKWVSITVVELF